MEKFSSLQITKICKESRSFHGAKPMSFLAFLFILLVGTGCVVNPASDPKNVTNMQTCYVVDYGEGVYFFPYILQDFGNALASFLRQNPSLQVTGIVYSTGDADGHFVTCRLKTAAESDRGPFPLLPSCEMSPYPTSSSAKDQMQSPVLPPERPAPPTVEPVVSTSVEQAVAPTKLAEE